MAADAEYVQGVRGWLTSRGLDPDSEELAGTPLRVLRALNEFTAGYDEDPAVILSQTFDVERSDEPIIVSNILFVSICAHHLLPFTGRAVIAYAPSPGARVVGLSKIPRLLDVYARRLQTQEQLTKQVTTALDTYLSAAGSACIVRSEHGCLAHRGAKKPGAVMTTASYSGVYLTDQTARADLHRLIKE